MNKAKGNFNVAGNRYISFWRCERGTTAIEYALIVALIVIVIVGAVTNLGTSVLNLFTRVVNSM